LEQAHATKYRSLLRHVLGAADVYWLLASLGRGWLHDRIEPLEARAWEASPTRFTFELSLTDGCRPVREFFLISRGWLSAVPTLIGLPRAGVELEFAGDNALLHAELPPPATWLTRWRSVPKSFRTLRIAVEELQAAHSLLNEQYQELRRAQATLHQSEARFRALIENSSDFILLTNASGVVTYLSPSAQRITGWPAEEAAGREHRELTHPDDQDALAAALRRLTREPGQTATLRVRFRARGGAWIRLEGTARNMLDDPLLRAILVNYRDVSDRARLEEQLLQSRKMESIGRLAGGLAHDFNNLLTGMLGNAELALLRLEASAPARQQMEQIVEYSRRGAELTSQLLAFARKQVVQPKPVNLNALVRQVLSLLDRLIGDHVEIVTSLEPALGTVEVDPGQFQQVIINLATNARDAMPRGGTLTIGTSNALCSSTASAERSPAQFVCLSVADTGEGMDEETRSRIFEPFFTTKELGYGTGLGLSTCHGIVTQAGGRIEVTSTLSSGATFRVYLPRVDRFPASEPHPSRSSEIPRGTETVLVVDDEGAVLQSTSELLRCLGYTVLTAQSGVEALKLVQAYSGELHAVVSDIVMPKVTGPQMVEVLLTMRPQLKALYTSAHRAYGHPFLPPEGTAFLQKPFELAALASALHQLLHS
jgi:PAS domain S-box-containing protein